LPSADSSGEPLDKKIIAQLKKEMAALKKPWDKWLAAKQAYDAYKLAQVRKTCMEANATVEYTEEIEHLRPKSPTGGTPMVVIVESVPSNIEKAVWPDELVLITGAKLDPKVRKDKAVAKKAKGVEANCFKSASVHDKLVEKLMALSNDPAVWKDVKVQAPKKKGKMKEPKEPKEPKGLMDPKEHFKQGKHDGKFEEYDDSGMPTKEAGGGEVAEKALKSLQKEFDGVKKTWDKHQETMAKYQKDLEEFTKQEAGEQTDDGPSGVPEPQRQAACEVAGLEVVMQLVHKFVLEHGDELAVEVNRGDKDPADLAAVMVKQLLEVEDKTTDPVLKALKKLDKMKRLGATSTSELPEVFKLLAEDELQVGTHISFGDITEEETSYVVSKLELMSITNGGQVLHDDLKIFIEGQDMPLKDGQPETLSACLTAMHIEKFNKNRSADVLMSPRSWRLFLGGGAPNGGDDGGKKDKGKTKKDKKAK